MALRGHRDSGTIFKACSDDKQNNDCNFREILRYRAQGDSDMISNLERSGTISTQVLLVKIKFDSCNKLLLNKIGNFSTLPGNPFFTIFLVDLSHFFGEKNVGEVRIWCTKLVSKL